MLIFLCGLSVFLLGIELSKYSIKKSAGQKINLLLESLSENYFLSLIMGVLVTSVLQSSSALTVIVISLLDTGLLSLKPALGLVMGANIGTTITVQIITLPLMNFYPYIFITAVFLILISICFKFKYRLFYLSLLLFSFALIFMGLDFMSSCFQKTEILKLMLEIFSSNNQRFIAVMAGLFITAVIQSSSAVTGIIISLAYNGTIDLSFAVAAALGSNIGTCITAFIASFNSQGSGKALAKGHFLFNMIGVVSLMPFFNIFTLVISKTDDNILRQIANAHTFFNIYNVIIFLPFINYFVKYLGGEKNEFN